MCWKQKKEVNLLTRKIQQQKWQIYMCFSIGSTEMVQHGIQRVWNGKIALL